ncbi:MAG: hypothetical protein M3N68_14480 [Actinomycetota bacterium]|nr:hypothetical protein [Actinomycetota bacterium]
MGSKRWFSLAAWLPLVLAAGAACGGSEGRGATQPAPDVSFFTEGDFEGLPRYPRSETLSGRTEKEGFVTRSFAVRNARPRQVLEWYAEQLDRWPMIEAIHKVGATDYRAAWLKEGRRLQVSAGPAPGTEGGDPAVQYSLVLGPAP